MTAHAGRRRAATQPLAGVRVVNLGWIWAAPALAGAMADMGADVIKIETGRRVDNTRRSGALYKDVPLLNHSSLTLLRGQRSVTLDLANPESRGVALEHHRHVGRRRRELPPRHRRPLGTRLRIGAARRAPTSS